MMRKVVIFLYVVLLAGFIYAQPSDKFSLTHSTFIATGETWSDVVLTTNTIRRGDSLAYITVASTSAVGTVSVYDGLDTGGALVAEVITGFAGYYPFEVILTSSSGQVTITKTGVGAVGLTFYITHPVF